MERFAEDLYWLGLNIYHEARGEQTEGKIAVCHVVMNRVITRGKTIKEIIMAPNQFSWTIGIDPDYYCISEPGEFRECIIATSLCLKVRASGFCLHGADHYFNPKVVLPSWAKSMKFIERIGNHDFYRDDNQMKFK